MRADIERALSGRPVLAPAVVARGSARDPGRTSWRGSADGNTATTAVAPRGASPYETESTPPSRTGIWVLVGVLAAAGRGVRRRCCCPSSAERRHGQAGRRAERHRQTVPQATATLQRAGLRPRDPDPRLQRDRAEGPHHLPGPDPAGSGRTRGRPSTSRCRLGRRRTPVPNLTNSFLKAAEAKLRSLGFSPRPEKVTDSTAALRTGDQDGPAGGNDPAGRDGRPALLLGRLHQGAQRGR